MPMYLYLGDITRMETDAIVNAAGTDLRRCPGHLRRDFRRRRHGEAGEGVPEAGPLPHRQAVATPGCGLPCRYIIHVAGPGWYGGEPRERFLLAGCYQNALHKAYLCSCRRVAVPLIFSGDCHMPRAASLRVAGAAIADFCQRHPSMEVTLVLYRQSIYDMAKRILGWEDAPS